MKRHNIKVETYSDKHPGYYVIKFRAVINIFGLKIPLSWKTLTYSVWIKSLMIPPDRDQPVFFKSINEAIDFIKGHGLEDSDNLDMFIKHEDDRHKENKKRYYDSIPKNQTHYIK